MKSLKTSIPDDIKTIDEAKAFLTELYNNGESYHPEDDAADIIWSDGRQLSQLEIDGLNLCMYKCCMIPQFDPCEFLLELIKGHSEPDPSAAMTLKDYQKISTSRINATGRTITLPKGFGKGESK